LGDKTCGFIGRRRPAGPGLGGGDLDHCGDQGSAALQVLVADRPDRLTNNDHLR